MKKIKQVVDVSISREETIIALKKVIKSPHAELIAITIVNHLETRPMGTAQLIKSISGIEDSLEYEIGQKVLTNLDNIYHWRLNREETKASNLAFKELAQGIITGFKMHEVANITIDYHHIDDSHIVAISSADLIDSNVIIDDRLLYSENVKKLLKT